MESEIKKILKEQVSPMLAFHRGDAEFISYKDGIVRLRLKGTCRGCPLASLTLKEGVETILREHLHGIERVEAVE